MVKLGNFTTAAFILLGVISLSTANPLLSAYGILVLFLLFRLLWFKNLPAILFYGSLFMWVQSFIRVFQANLEGIAIDSFDQSSNASLSSFSALTSVLLIALTLHIIIRKVSFNLQRFQETLSRISVKKAFILFLVLFFSQPIIRQLAIGGLTQFILPILSLKWLAYCLLLYLVVMKKEGYLLLLASFSIEFFLSFGGYFSDFKNVILFSIITYMGIIKKLNNRQVFLGLSFAIPIIILISFWTNIKKDYRGFVSGNERTQFVVVSRSEAVNYIVQEARDFDREAFSNSITPLLTRLQYTRMMQYCMDYVPAVLPFEDGKLWKGAVLHILMPRFLFPGKPILNDSDVANKYTGMEWAGAAEGTSISIGFITESYVDFGEIGLYIPILLLAILIGFIFRFFLRLNNKYLYLDYFALIPILFPFSRIETSGNKLLGAIVMAALVYTFIIRPLLYPIIARWLFRK